RGVVTDGGDGELHVRIFANVARHALGGDARLVERRALGRAQVDLEARLVVHGQEALVRLHRERRARTERAKRGNDDDPPAAHQEREDPAVDALDRAIERVDDALAERLVTLFGFLEPT